MRTLGIVLLIGAAVGGYFVWKSNQNDDPLDQPPSGESSFDNAESAIVGVILSVATKGYRNNNPLNLRYIADPAKAWNGQIADDNGYAVYDTMADGVRAASRQIQKHAKNGATTIRKLITVWAPEKDNNPTEAYINYVATRLNVSADAQLNMYAELPELFQAMAHFENGADGLKFQDITNWVYT